MTIVGWPLGVWMLCGVAAGAIEWDRLNRSEGGGEARERIYTALDNTPWGWPMAACLMFVFGPVALALDLALPALFWAITAFYTIRRRFAKPRITITYAGGPIDWECQGCGKTGTVGKGSYADRIRWCQPCLDSRGIHMNPPAEAARIAPDCTMTVVNNEAFARYLAEYEAKIREHVAQRPFDTSAGIDLRS